MKKRGLVIGLLMMLAVITSGFTYAFWASSVTGNSDTAVGTINIGSGDPVTTTVTVNPETLTGGLLVPSTVANDTTTFSVITLQFNVAWIQDAAGAAGTTGTLTGAVTSWDVFKDVDVEGVPTPTSTGLSEGEKAALFTVVVTSGNGSITLGANRNVVVTITFLAEPSTVAIYNKVAGGDIVINLTFDIPNNSLVLPGE